MPEKFRIESLEIEGFRGINEKRGLRLDKPFVILHGENGHGKSSTLGAIEWCLFGEFLSVKPLETPRTKDELINSIHPAGAAKVRLTLSNGNGKYEFLREKKLGTRKMNFLIRAPEGDYKTPQSQKMARQILGLNLEDFQRTVFLHQESVRGLLTDDSGRRDEAMDRLFGLEKLRDITESIPIGGIKKELASLESEKSRLQERMKGALLEIEQKIKKLQEDAKELGLRKDELVLKNAITISKEITSNLKTVTREYGLEIPQIPQTQNLPGLKGLAKNAKAAINRCRKSMPEMRELDSLSSRRTRLVKVQTKYREVMTAFRKVKSSLDSKVRKFGNTAKVSHSIESLNKRVSDLEQQRRKTDAKARVLQDAIEYLGASTEKICPVCSQMIDRSNVASQIRRHIRKHGKKMIGSIKRKIEACESQMKELEQAKKDIMHLQKDLKDSGKAVSSSIEVMHKAMERPEIPKSQLPKLLSAEISKVSRQIGRIESSITGREKRFQKIEDKIEQVKTIREFLVEEERRDEIDRIFSSEKNQISILKNEIIRLKSFQNDLEFIMKAVADYQVNLAKNMIGKSSGSIKQFCTRLCGHPYFRTLEIGVEPKESRGQIKNTYSIKASNPSERKETLVSTRFSVGQMNCVALSIYLALSKILPHKLGFLILDDPSQSLDVHHQHALVDLIRKVNHNTQVIVSTHDEQFKKLMTSRLNSNGKYVYNYVSWSKSGPEIRTSK